MSRLAALNLVVLLVSGCTFSAPQFEAAFRLIERAAAVNGAMTEESRPMWFASVGDRGAVLTPFSSGGLTVFANAAGDAIAFDGWTIRSIIGFGLTSPISIAGKNGRRVFVFGDAETATNCDAWTRAEFGWKQVCGNGEGQIKVDESGEIKSITMALGDALGIVTIRAAI